MDQEHIIEVKETTIFQDGQTVLDHVNFSILQEEFVYLIVRQEVENPPY